MNGFVGFLKTETDSGSTSKAKGSSSQSKGNVDRSSYADQDDAVADDARTPLQSQTPADDDVRPDDSQVDTQHIEDQTEVAVSAEFEEPDASQKQNGSEPTDNRDETDDDAVDAAELVAQLVVTDTNAQRIEITGDLKTEDAQEPASDALEIDSESSAQAVNDAVLSTTPATDAATASNAQLADTQTVAVQNVIDVKSKDVHRSSDVHATKVREPSKQVDAKIQADVPATTADSEQSISTHDVKDAATRNIQSETQKPADQSVTDAKPQTNPVTDVQAESVVETRTPSEESSSKPTDKDSRDKATKVANFILQRSEPGDSAASARAEQINAQIALENATDVKSDSKSVNADANGVQVDSLLRAVSMKGSHATAEGGSGLTSNSGNTQNDTSLTNQVVRGMNAIVNQRGGVMTLRLSPPELGDIRIQMTLTQGNVAADLRASTPQAQEAL
ncbi:MAG TPA: flagellar hook-length control protein FliK, partial [Phycisphaerales bacterium]|nr:flagellar hook-length control protein FliK [Phycisphaerales bacterium]